MIKRLFYPIIILLDMISILFVSVLYPFPYLLEIVITVPKTIFSQLNAHKVLAGSAAFCVSYSFGIGHLYPDANSVHALINFISDGYWKDLNVGVPLLGISAVIAIGLCLLLTYISSVFRSLDDRVYNVRSALSDYTRRTVNHIKRRFTLFLFGSFRKKELFDMRTFRKQYSLSC